MLIKTEWGNVTLKLDEKNKLEVHLPQGVSGRILTEIRKLPEFQTGVASLTGEVAP